MPFSWLYIYRGTFLRLQSAAWKGVPWCEPSMDTKKCSWSCHQSGSGKGAIGLRKASQKGYRTSPR